LALFGLAMGVSVVAFGASVWSSVKPPASAKRSASSSSPRALGHPAQPQEKKAHDGSGNESEGESFLDASRAPVVADARKGNW
jgi:hypothetical protein